MNRPERLPITTTAAEGLPRRRFSVAEVEQMSAAGVLEAVERIELIGGEIVPMSPKGNHRESLKTALTIYWARILPPALLFTTETTFRLSVDTYLEPDFVFYPKSIGARDLDAATANLMVEISDCSLGYDVGRKTALYAGFGIGELWVIDAGKLVTHMHREPSPSGYGSIARRPESARLVTPDLAVTLAELDLH